ncbi:MAG: formylmethanofuran dehydrogenase subunit C [Thermoprotei archaeon]|nr:MAG: formylmethanofuran dehydrogenase subunit C [Thermoprotei archaeon]
MIMGRRFILKPVKEFSVPIEAEKIKPDVFAEKSLEELKGLTVYEGNGKCRLEELFHIEDEEVEGDNIEIVLEGDFGKVWRIGEGMTFGEIVINGSCGHFTGYGMKGGKITIKGNAGSWLGGEMKGGTIEVFGNAGDHVGAVLRGLKKSRGMKGGIIVIHGNAGAEVGAKMSKGFIAVDGNCGVLPGLYMSGGTILIRGDCQGKAGARMSGGKIIICGHAGGVLPTFYIDSIVPKVKAKKEKIEGPFYLFLGDVLEDIRCMGRLFINVNKNPELAKVKELLGGEVE